MVSRLWWNNVFYFSFYVIFLYSMQASCFETGYVCKNVYNNLTRRSICHNNFTIQHFRLSPYNLIINLEEIIKKCCGESKQITTLDKELINISEIPSALSEGSPDFILPCLASSTATSFYGYHFIPVIKAPSFYYITCRPESLFVRVVKACLDLYPLLTVVLLLVVITGFLAWLMETWSNKEEFPREFLLGWFEGFWWSFISMTTVGYGDKIPRSFPARLFSIIWIVTGVSFFGIITASLTTILTRENSPSAPTMSGANVGLIRHRDLDKFVVAQNGGIPRYDNDKYQILLSYLEIDTLIDNLMKKKVDGVLMDKYTLKEYTDFASEADFDPELKMRTEFLKSAVKTEVITQGLDLSYGILVRNVTAYEFFRQLMMDHQLYIETRAQLKWNKKQKKVDELFSSSEPYFLFMIQIMLGIIGLICMFGVIYEIIRRYLCKKGKKSDKKPQKNRTHKQSRSFLHA